MEVLTPKKMQLHFLLNDAADEYVLQCKVCLVKCRNGAHLRFHRHKHGDAKLFPCTSCEIAFYRRFSLDSHKRCVHMKERKFTCDICSSRFFYQKDLNKHRLAVHDKERPHRCPQCAASFGKKEHLTRHYRTLHLRA
eukprot:Plantae.Rhodophyta-Purpureofilum_apyrenoidigerum.ctg19679.p2 GENE.Plantae.Rhodophyta-Purpureofilum_apyrenoidigerum.ctg19679~~Plantae.Rhodophyta-Purpureofilum_apyrenoidigerum.ctg19679.p2  ORF type:complete len:156 (+),score=29.40 Plantae.Rhodophyta-Purpureofilum_apyrenoidigerum.ctg19679:58-468(+)